MCCISNLQILDDRGPNPILHMFWTVPLEVKDARCSSSEGLRSNNVYSEIMASIVVPGKVHFIREI